MLGRWSAATGQCFVLAEGGAADDDGLHGVGR